MDKLWGRPALPCATEGCSDGVKTCSGPDANHSETFAPPVPGPEFSLWCSSITTLLSSERLAAARSSDLLIPGEFIIFKTKPNLMLTRVLCNMRASVWKTGNFNVPPGLAPPWLSETHSLLEPKGSGVQLLGLTAGLQAGAEGPGHGDRPAESPLTTLPPASLYFYNLPRF